MIHEVNFLPKTLSLFYMYHCQMSLMRLSMQYMMYLHVLLSLICLPWILANLLDGLPCRPCLPWPQRAFALLLAAPLLPIALLPVIVFADNLVYMNNALYIGPILIFHVLAALLQTASLLVTSSLLTTSIRDIFHISILSFKGAVS
jgi:hypothetical protein